MTNGNGDIPNPEAWLQGPRLSGYIDPVALHQVDLFWTAPSKPYPGIATYSIYRGLNGATPTLLVGGLSPTTLSYQDTTVAPGLNTYVYYVSVAFSGNPSLPSNRLSFLGGIQDVFNSNSTWVNRTGSRYYDALAIGAGGGGTSGDYNNDGLGAGDSDVLGGGGGGGGGYASVRYQSSDLTATVAVTVGAAGVGGATQTVITAITGVGLDGTAGGASTFGSYITANGGGHSNRLSIVPAVGGTASVAGGTSVYTETGAAGGGYYNTSAPPDVARPGGTSNLAGAGGAGGQNNPNHDIYSPAVSQPGSASTNGAAGAAGVSAYTTIPGQTVTATAGGNGTSVGFTGSGSGGGGGYAAQSATSASGGTVTGGAGGSGGYGAGGGGGGAVAARAVFAPIGTAITGAGGNGGPGVVVVTTYFW